MIKKVILIFSCMIISIEIFCSGKIISVETDKGVFAVNESNGSLVVQGCVGGSITGVVMGDLKHCDVVADGTPGSQMAVIYFHQEEGQVVGILYSIK